MGCRSFLTVEDSQKNADGSHKFYGRFNQGVVTINLPDVALSSGGNIEKFWEIFEERLELCHRALLCRYGHVGRQEAAAAHADVAVALAVFVHLQLQHLLLRDVVGNHPLGGALGRQLREIPEDSLSKLVETRLREEVRGGVQTIQYQVLTLLTTNGQAPFVTVFMYLGESTKGARWAREMD